MPFWSGHETSRTACSGGTGWIVEGKTISAPQVFEVSRRGGRSESGRAGFGHGVVLVARTPTHPDGAYYFAIALERYPTGKNHDLAVVGGMDAEKLPARLRVCSQVFGGDIECSGGISLFHGNIDAADPGAIHAHVGHNVAAAIGYGDIHRLSDGTRFLFRRGDDAASVLKFDHILVPPEINQILRAYRFKSLMISRAAFMPEVPVKPSPGCVPEPHR